MDVAGLNIEDQVFPKRCGHMAGKEIIDADEMVGKVRACAEVRDQLDGEFIINARTDAFAPLGIVEAIRRCNLYLEAGADLAFIDGIRTKSDIAQAVKALNGPLSVNLMDGISGMKTELVPVPELARMGVGRVSIPVASCMVAHKALVDFFAALRQSPSGILAGQTHWTSSFEEFTDFVRLKEYRKREEEYLPEKRMVRKYRGARKIVG
jgi:methylisocitrate lyase